VLCLNYKLIALFFTYWSQGQQTLTVQWPVFVGFWLKKYWKKTGVAGIVWDKFQGKPSRYLLMGMCIFISYVECSEFSFFERYLLYRRCKLIIVCCLLKKKRKRSQKDGNFLFDGSSFTSHPFPVDLLTFSVVVTEF